MPKEKITLHYTDISRSSMQRMCTHWRQILGYNKMSWVMKVGAMWAQAMSPLSHPFA